MASVGEIAKKLGCSSATVSRALNPATAHLVREQTRQRIFAECEKNNFRPDNSARSLASGRTYKIGMILGNLAQDLGNQLHGIALSAACRKLQEKGYNMLVLGADNVIERDQDIINFLRSNVADGYIIGGSIVSDSVYQAVCECDRPVVTTCQELSGHCSLFLGKDLTGAFSDIWKRIPDEWRNDELLYCQSGHDDYKYPVILETAPAGRQIELLQMEKKVNIFSFDRSLTTESLQKDLPLLLNKKLIWCCSDLTALGVMDLLSSCGRVLGKDYFLIGFDNIEALSGLEDRAILSTIDSRQKEYGTLTAEMILQALEDPAEKVIRFPFKYISRMSFPF